MFREIISISRPAASSVSCLYDYDRELGLSLTAGHEIWWTVIHLYVLYPCNLADFISKLILLFSFSLSYVQN